LTSSVHLEWIPESPVGPRVAIVIALNFSFCLTLVFLLLHKNDFSFLNKLIACKSQSVFSKNLNCSNKLLNDSELLFLTSVKGRW
jgi:hypothetical protein